MIDAGYWDFEWDDVKAAINERKHGVTFDEATEAFDDPWARVIDGPDHSFHPHGHEPRCAVANRVPLHTAWLDHPHHLSPQIDQKRGKAVLEVPQMRDEYDFSDSRPNPYAGRLRRAVTMNLDVANIDYFKAESARTGVPYQNIINLYLTQCREQDKHLEFA